MKRDILFKRLKVDAPIGLLPHELQKTQPIFIDAQFTVRTRTLKDDVEMSTVLDYRLLREAMINEVLSSHTYLVEVLADRLVRHLFREFDDIAYIKLTVFKPHAFSDCDEVGVGVECCRTEFLKNQ